MTPDSESEKHNYELAIRWCAERGTGWKVVDTAGRGGTAPVFTVESPDGLRALKLLDEDFSQGARRDESKKRIALQVERIGDHDCPYLVKVYDGGEFEDRLYLLMNKAPGKELAQVLSLVPRERIATIVDQVAQAALFLRSQNLSHRDIKSANVFVTHDFSHATLLDVSVARDVYDPVGLGTDQGGQLPVVATTRYTPPEYLFRLIAAGPELWHAVDVYQLGGLIHDLVMREPMFEAEYKLSSTNKYRFAWLVATQTPEIAGDDVDPALIFLGRRCLDKDWRRRSALGLEDFLLNRGTRERLGLEAIGFAPRRDLGDVPANAMNLRQIAISQAEKLKEAIIAYQQELGIRATHKVVDGERDNQKVVSIEWSRNVANGQPGFRQLHLEFHVEASVGSEGVILGLHASLTAVDQEGERTSTIDLPPVTQSDDTANIIFSSCIGAISVLAAQLMGAE